MDPFTIALASAGIGAAGSIASGYLSSKNSGQETKNQKTSRKLVDKLLASLEGNGPYSDLFNTDQESFQKSFVDPAKSMFNNQIAPQIQQQYIASGQQRGTGLDDTLTRAGVDLDQLLNQQYADYQQGALNRKQNTISSILNQGAGGSPGRSTGESASDAFSGYLSSNSFQNSISDLTKQFASKNPQQSLSSPSTMRKGFAPDLNDIKFGQRSY